MNKNNKFSIYIFVSLLLIIIGGYIGTAETANLNDHYFALKIGGILIGLGFITRIAAHWLETK